jgi:hypothetical protein
MSSFPPGLEPAHDLSPSHWVQEALEDWPSGPFRVRDLVPGVFEAYARVLHPPRRPTDLQISTGTWSARAAELGRPLTPETRWEDLDGAGSDSWSLWPGELMGPELATLAGALKEYTSDPAACWFALWDGWGDWGAAAYHMAGGPRSRRLATWQAKAAERWRNRRIRRERRRLVTFPLLRGNRRYVLLKGPVKGAEALWSSLGHCPTLWWPDDRGWFVHTEIDGTSTYVGGSRPMIGQLVGEQILESFEVDPSDLARL